MLSAVHTEFRDISNRSLNVVVSGLKPSSIDNDAAQFSELCASELIIYPSVKSTHRLGNVISGRIQPLLVTLQSTDDVREILQSAKLLRNSTSNYVRNSIFINKHMTKAESLAAFNIRKKNREKRDNKNLTQSSSSVHPVTSVSDSTYGMDSIPGINHATSVTSDVSRQTNNIPLRRSDSTIPINIYSSSSSHQGSSQPAVVSSGLNQIYMPAPSYFTVMNPTPQCSSSFNIDHGNYSNVIPPPSSFITSNSSMPINPYLSQSLAQIFLESNLQEHRDKQILATSFTQRFSSTHEVLKTNCPNFITSFIALSLNSCFLPNRGSMMTSQIPCSTLSIVSTYSVATDWVDLAVVFVLFYLGQSIVFKMINLIPMQIICVNLYVLMPNLVILDTSSLSYTVLHIHASKLEPTY